MTTSPVFVATFDDADKTVTRMTTFCEDDKLDVARGVILSRRAYRQRTGQRAPALVQAHFERDGNVLETYNALQLANGGVVPEKGEKPTQSKSSTK